MPYKGFGAAVIVDIRNPQDNLDAGATGLRRTPFSGTFMTLYDSEMRGSPQGLDSGGKMPTRAKTRTCGQI
jgi:hypothetical protein